MKNYLIKKWKKWHEYPEPSNKYCPCEDGNYISGLAENYIKSLW